MEKWSRSVAVVTEANIGCGFEVLKELATAGITVVGFDTKTENIDKFKSENPLLKVFSVVCDISDEDETEIAFEWVEDTLGGVDILITNSASATCGNVTNIKSSRRCGKFALKSMKARGFYGLIINIVPQNHPEEPKQNEISKIRVETIEVDRDSSKKVVELVKSLLSAPLV
jgi:NADP-dependent 3-hydroxy acid dehydrogenase YdfG